MVPAALVVLEALPVGPVGKLDRGALPAPVYGGAAYTAPRTGLERTLVGLFAEVLGVGVDDVGIDDSFFELGGNSLSAVRLASELEVALSRKIALSAIFLEPTPAALARRLGTPSGAAAPSPADGMDVVIALRDSGSRDPLFCVHPAVGISWVYAGLLQYLPDRPVYGLQLPSISGGPAYASVRDLARRYVDELRTIRFRGPYHLLGWSHGGLVAHAMAVELRTAGEEVDLTMLDAYPIARGPQEATLAEMLAGLGIPVDDVDPASLSYEDAVALVNRSFGHDTGLDASHLERIMTGYAHIQREMTEIDPSPFVGDLLFFAAASSVDSGAGVSPGLWQRFVTGTIDEHTLRCDHLQMMSPESAAVVGPILDEYLSGRSR
nr:thioesterase domain-containing protein [Rhodococcus sp. 14C212]